MTQSVFAPNVMKHNILYCMPFGANIGGIVGATHWLELKAGARIGAGAETVFRGLDNAGRAENRGNVGRPFP